MPSDNFFSFRILVNGQVIPEYVKNEKVYVESNLFTPVSYTQTVTEVVNDETETQDVPVTPYTIQVAVHGTSLPPEYSHYIRVSVDGEKVQGIALNAGESRNIVGFRDGNLVRELLFSLPKNSKHVGAGEGLDDQKMLHVGQIEVKCWKAKRLQRSCELRQKMLQFKQASKHDVHGVTKGSYTLATSKAGKAVTVRGITRQVDQWRKVELLSEQTVHYRMGHTLTDMGIVIAPYNALGEGVGRLTEVKDHKIKDDKHKLESVVPPTHTVTGGSFHHQTASHKRKNSKDDSDRDNRSVKRAKSTSTKGQVSEGVKSNKTSRNDDSDDDIQVIPGPSKRIPDLVDLTT